MKDCTACLEPQHCDCLCGTCVGARLSYANHQRRFGYQDALHLWEPKGELPPRQEGDSQYARGWNQLIDEVEEGDIDDQKPLSRSEKLQRSADAGFDTWEDYRGEK